jgi:prepilin-type processing-associated H-X9-DG protein
LVVIGIIAVLIAILLPSLSKARQQGNWAACLSNMRQIGQALLIYSNENRGYMPRPASGGHGAYPDDFINWLQAPTYTGGVTYPLDDSVLAKPLGIGGDKLKKIFRCPSDIPSDRPPQSGRETYGTFMFSYSLNDEWSPWKADHVPPSVPPPNNLTSYGGTFNNTLTAPRKRLSMVVQAGEKICVVEDSNPDDGRWTHIPGPDDLGFRHAGQANVLYHDWHVGKVDPTIGITTPAMWDPFN